MNRDEERHPFLREASASCGFIQ